MLPPDVQQLLLLPTFIPSLDARADLESGRVDARLVAALTALARGHTIEVSKIKTGHPMGPTSPNGVVNSHYDYRAADIVAVAGHPIAGHATNPAVLGVGRVLRGLSPQERPDRIYGPATWHTTLRYPADTGFVSDAFHDHIHADHLHLGFATATGTANRE